MVVSMLCQYADYIALLTDANVNNMLFVETLKLVAWHKLVEWHSGRTSVSDWRTFPVSPIPDVSGPFAPVGRPAADG